MRWCICIQSWKEVLFVLLIKEIIPVVSSAAVCHCFSVLVIKEYQHVRTYTAALCCYYADQETLRHNEIFKWTPAGCVYVCVCVCVCVWSEQRSDGADGWWLQICDPQPIKQTLPASFHFLLIFVHFNVNFFYVFLPVWCTIKNRKKRC